MSALCDCREYYMSYRGEALGTGMAPPKHQVCITDDVPVEGIPGRDQ